MTPRHTLPLFTFVSCGISATIILILAYLSAVDRDTPGAQFLLFVDLMMLLAMGCLIPALGGGKVLRLPIGALDFEKEKVRRTQWQRDHWLATGHPDYGTAGGDTWACTTCKAEFDSPFTVQGYRKPLPLPAELFCGMAFCTQTFASHLDLIRHQQAEHSSEAPWYCGTCKAPFPSRAAVETHIDAVHETRWKSPHQGEFVGVIVDRPDPPTFFRHPFRNSIDPDGLCMHCNCPAGDEIHI